LVIAAQKAYANSVKWVKSGRAPRRYRWRIAQRAFGGSFVAGILLMSLIALVSPDSFGAPGSNTLRSGWPLYVLLGLIGVSVVFLLTGWRRAIWLLARLRDTLLRQPEGDPRYEGAAANLAETPGPFRLRFVLWWVWGPAAIAVLGGMCSFSAAYFLVDAVLARFRVGLETPILAAANLILSLVVFRLIAARLSTWRLAVSVHRSVTQGL